MSESPYDDELAALARAPRAKRLADELGQLSERPGLERWLSLEIAAQADALLGQAMDGREIGKERERETRLRYGLHVEG